jgi:hypothetical protein
MSYRMYVEDFQLFGNNEQYKIWDDFIRSEGIKISEDGYYDGYITNIPGAIHALEEIIIQIATDRINRLDKYTKELDDELKDLDSEEAEKERKHFLKYGPKDIFDYRDIYQKYKEQDESYGLIAELDNLYNEGYLFFGSNFIKACGKKIHWTIDKEHDYSMTWEIRDGEKIHVYAR